MVVNIIKLSSAADFFQNQLFSKNYFRNLIIVSKGLDPNVLSVLSLVQQ